MPSASIFLVSGLVAAVVLSAIAWLRRRPTRSPLRSVDEFNETLRALAPRRRRD